MPRRLSTRSRKGSAYQSRSRTLNKKKSPSLVSLFSRKKNIMIVFFVILSFSFISLFVLVHLEALGVDHRSESTVHKGPLAMMSKDSLRHSQRTTKLDPFEANSRKLDKEKDDKDEDTAPVNKNTAADHNDKTSGARKPESNKDEEKDDKDEVTAPVNKNPAADDNDKTSGARKPESNKDEEKDDKDAVDDADADDEYETTSGTLKPESNEDEDVDEEEAKDHHKAAILKSDVGRNVSKIERLEALQKKYNIDPADLSIDLREQLSDLANEDAINFVGKREAKEDGKLRWEDAYLKLKRYAYEPKDFPPNYNMTASSVDVLGKAFNVSSLHRLVNLTNELPNLGVLLDAGRHYFPVDWIKRMIHVLSIMNYNYLQFRLTDDQTFNVQLKSQPQLAHPTTLNNNTKVYSPGELRDIVKYAKSKGIAVIPEINIPGHAASWGGVPELIVQCPKFICSQGYGVPLNVTHPSLRRILVDVLTEIIDIFDDPPYLHLGGDEVNMAIPCFREIGEKIFDYNNFERMLHRILKQINYDESKVIRWEMSDVLKLRRAGQITQFWLRKPGAPDWNRLYGKDFNESVFLSSGLYFDTNEEDSAFDVYIKTKQLKHNLHTNSSILGIVAGTFELSTDFWLDRNVVGRLLAVSMGVSGLDTTNRGMFFLLYQIKCRSAGFPDTMCNLYGVPPIRYSKHRSELKGGGSVWEKWIRNTCNRLTEKEEYIAYNDISYNSRRARTEAMTLFWDTYYEQPDWEVDVTNATTKNATPPLGGNRLVNYTGVIIDIARYPLDGFGVLETFIKRTMGPLGLNMIQMRLVTDISFAYFSYNFPKLYYQHPLFKKVSQINEYPTMEILRSMKNMSDLEGIVIMPEIAISTNAGGHVKSSFNVKCPYFLCEHAKYIPQDINDNMYPPLVFSLVKELTEITSSPYIHLGYDERTMSTPCFLEATNNLTSPNFDNFETKIGQMLQFAGITSDRVIRWENNEKINYPSRFGDITQCASGETCRLASVKNDKTKFPWFGTIDVRVGGPYEIYSTTRDLAARSPLGLVAEIGSIREDDEPYLKHKIDYRLLAFSIGTLDLPVMSKVEFENYYVKICSTDIVPAVRHYGQNSTSFENRTRDCKAFATVAHNNTERYKADEEFSQKFQYYTCRERTKVAKQSFMRHPSTIETAVSLNGETIS